jgi:hypothetical protein
MNRNLHKKLSDRDWFAYFYYPDHAKRAITKQEKKESHQALRKYNKQAIQNEILEYEDEQMSFCDGMCPECYFNDSCCNYYGPERDASDWRLYNDLKEDEYD